MGDSIARKPGPDQTPRGPDDLSARARQGPREIVARRIPSEPDPAERPVAAYIRRLPYQRRACIRRIQPARTAPVLGILGGFAFCSALAISPKWSTNE